MPAPFELALCNFGLSDIDDLDAALTVVTAAQRTGGRLVLSILQPCFPGAGTMTGQRCCSLIDTKLTADIAVCPARENAR